MLAISDVQNAVKIIDHCAQEGAFKGWETIEQVLAVRNRLVEFLKEVASKDDTSTNEAPGDFDASSAAPVTNNEPA